MGLFVAAPRPERVPQGFFVVFEAAADAVACALAAQRSLAAH
jgi:hypothetical protein